MQVGADRITDLCLSFVADNEGQTIRRDNRSSIGGTRVAERGSIYADQFINNNRKLIVKSSQNANVKDLMMFDNFVIARMTEITYIHPISSQYHPHLRSPVPNLRY